MLLIFLIYNLFKLWIIAEESDSSQKKKSKISIQMEELKNKSKKKQIQQIMEESDYLSEFNDELKELTFSNISGNENENENKIKNYNIYFYLSLDKENSFVFPIKSEFFKIDKQYAYELIKNIVKKINNENINIKYNSKIYIISLKDIEDDDDIDFYIKNYELRPCKKKNFMPKSDCPSYSSSSLLKNIEKENISFVSKLSLNIMIREKYL